MGGQVNRFGRLKTPEDLFFARLAAALRMELTVAELADRMRSSAGNHDLADLLRERAETARRHVTNVEAAFRLAGKEPWERPCTGVDGLIREGETTLRRAHPDLRDATIVASARAILAYGAATYATLLDLAGALGAHDVVVLLRENFDDQNDAGVAIGTLAGTLTPARRTYA
ncbi:MAG: DUF892 family protein [Patulibacter sp.]|nr:DUF892 family protein [Patulibacter sp.]